MHAAGFSIEDYATAIQENPRICESFYDSQLAEVARACSGPFLDPSDRDRVLAELCFRSWLFRDALTPPLRLAADQFVPREMRDWTTTHLVPRRPELTTHRDASARLAELLRDEPMPTPIRQTLRACFCERLRDFTSADGYILVVSGATSGSEAWLLPFALILNGGSGKIIDVDGCNCANWRAEAQTLWKALGHQVDIQLKTSLGKRQGALRGASFGLPVLLAYARRYGTLDALPPLAVLLTGRIGGDGLRTVSGLAPKQALARRLAVRLFAFPGDSGSKKENILPIAPGTPCEEVKRVLEIRLAQLLHADLSPLEIRNRLKVIKNSLHLGRLSLIEAQTGLHNLHTQLQKHSDDFAQEAWILFHLVSASVANHAGDPVLGRKHGINAERLASRSRVLYVDGIATSVVSLTDRGELDAALALGERCLPKLRKNSWRMGIDDLLEARMKLYGAIGGQALLQMGLRLPYPNRLADKSLDYLQRALEYARQLNRDSEICRDAVQVAQWYAYFKPTEAPMRVQEAEATLQSQASADAAQSIPYLQRTRWLGAYRLWLLHGRVQPGWESWSLPPATPPYLQWVRATSLKYRGTLFAAAGKPSGALADFTEATDIISAESGHVLRFITGTIFLQAGESLMQSKPSQAREFMAQARSIFARCAEGQPSASAAVSAAWVARCDELLSQPAMAVALSPSLQAQFPY